MYNFNHIQSQKQILIFTGGDFFGGRQDLCFRHIVQIKTTSAQCHLKGL